jgi:hypothetical protein
MCSQVEMSSNRLPEAVRSIYEELRSAVILIHAHWKMYQELYQKNHPTRLELLRESADNFFCFPPTDSYLRDYYEY